MLIDADSRVLEESIGVIREQAYLMKSAMDAGNIREVLKHSSALIGELRTSALPPKRYYELYMQVFQELQHLYVFFCDKMRRRRRLAELYESVQHAGNVVPRLYLLVTVGAACVAEKEIQSRDVLLDLNELCKGVQQPLRGLFLRYFLVQMMKNVLPDVGHSDYPDWSPLKSSSVSNELSSTEISYNFLYTNWVEATKLWTRLQFQSAVQDRVKRESDRYSLRVLVGANLVCMAQLDGMSVAFYKAIALPKLVAYSKGLKDVMAQQYLLECIVQAFSDECHLATLEILLDAIVSSSSAVDVKAIYGTLFSRLKAFLLSPEGLLQTLGPLFEAQRGTHGANLAEASLEEEHGSVADHSLVDDEQLSCASSYHVKKSDSHSPTESREANIQPPPIPPPEVNGNLPTAATIAAVTPTIPELNTLLKPSFSAEGDQFSLTAIDNNSIKEALGNLQIRQPPPPSALKRQKAQKSSQPTRMEMCVAVFTAARESLMDLIQKAYDEDFRFRSQPSPTSQKAPVKAALLYRLCIPNLLQILTSFLDFTLTILPKRVDLIDSIFQLVFPLVTASHNAFVSETGSARHNPELLKSFGSLLAVIMRRPTCFSLLYGYHYKRVFESLDDATKMAVSLDIVAAVLESEGTLEDPLVVEKLYSFVGAFLALPAPHYAVMQMTPDQAKSSATWLIQIQQIAQLSHLISNKNTDLELAMLTTAKATLVRGHKSTLAICIPALVFHWLSLVPRVQEIEIACSEVSTPVKSVDADEALTEVGTQNTSQPEISSRRVLQQVHAACVELVDCCPETVFRLLLLAAETSAQAELRQPTMFSAICNEFLKQSLVCYEEDLTDNKCKVKALPLLVGFVSSIGKKALDVDSYGSLAEVLTRHAAKLLKASDQCRAILACTHLFWDSQNEKRIDMNRVLQCLQRSLTLANASIQFNASDAPLFVDILEKYIFFFENRVEEGAITAEAISNLMSLCGEQLSFAASSSTGTTDACKDTVRAGQKHLANIVSYVRNRARFEVNSRYYYVDTSFMS